MNTGSLYFNYKQSFSIVLMALCNANYNFLYCDVGVQGRIADGGVFLNTDLSEALQKKQLKIPNRRCLPSTNTKLPFVIVADDAFALSEYIMKPFPGRHPKGSVERAYNYRHSRSRRVIENVFGILTAVFRVLRKPILLSPERAKWVVLACVYLHNFLRNRKNSRSVYTPATFFDREDSDGNVIPGDWKTNGFELPGLQRGNDGPHLDSLQIRNEFSQYFRSHPLPWQQRLA